MAYKYPLFLHISEHIDNQYIKLILIDMSVGNMPPGISYSAKHNTLQYKSGNINHSVVCNNNDNIIQFIIDNVNIKNDHNIQSIILSTKDEKAKYNSCLAHRLFNSVCASPSEMKYLMHTI